MSPYSEQRQRSCLLKIVGSFLQGGPFFSIPIDIRITRSKLSGFFGAWFTSHTIIVPMSFHKYFTLCRLKYRIVMPFGSTKYSRDDTMKINNKSPQTEQPIKKSSIQLIHNNISIVYRNKQKNASMTKKKPTLNPNYEQTHISIRFLREFRHNSIVFPSFRHVMQRNCVVYFYSTKLTWKKSLPQHCCY